MKRTVHNGWDKASNMAVREKYLKVVGHTDSGEYSFALLGYLMLGRFILNMDGCTCR